MEPRKLTDRVQWMGAVDWNRRLFDTLIPLPDGTSYNAYLIKGSEKTVLIDAVDPAMQSILLHQLKGVERIDYIVSQHTEQDHSGAIPILLEKYPNSTLLCSEKAKGLLIDHLLIDPARIKTVADEETLSLGDCNLKFYMTPWVHWPETMVTYLPEDKLLFSCDFLGSHIATTRLLAGNDPFVAEAAKRYFAEIMMPFRTFVKKNLEKIKTLDVAMVAPSHGPVYDQPDWIIKDYEDWVSDRYDNLVVLPYISMHGSTEVMTDFLLTALVKRGIEVQKFELSTTDIGKLAMSLVSALTIVIGTPTVHVGPHPTVFSATHLANALKPKLKYAAIIGSYGWGTKAVEQISGLIPNLKVEVLGTTLCKGYPKEADFAALDALAETIAQKHRAHFG